MSKQKRLARAEVMEREAAIQAKVEREFFGREVSQPATCSAYHSAFTGTIRCKCKPLRIITYISLNGDLVSGDYCAKHALELGRDERRGKLEILSDEPLYPLFGEASKKREIGLKGFYGV